MTPQMQIKIINYGDIYLRRRGKLDGSEIRSATVVARATDEEVFCRVPAKLDEELDLEPSSIAADRRLIEIEYNGVRTMEEAIVGGDEVVVGMTVLAKLNLVIDQDGQVITNPRRKYIRV